MDIPTAINMVQGFITLVLLGLVCVVALAVYWFENPTRKLASFRTRLPRDWDIDKAELVTLIDDTDLRKGIAALKSYPAAVGAFEPDRVRLVSGDGTLQTFTPSNSRIALIDYDGLSAVPTLLRIDGDDKKVYIAKRNRLTNWDKNAVRNLYTSLSIKFKFDDVQSNPKRFSLKPPYLALFSILILGGIALVITNAAGHPLQQSPQQIAQLHDNRIIALSNTHLYEFDADGQLLIHRELGDIGITEGVSDISVTEAGEVIVADNATGRLHRCQKNPWHCELVGERKHDPRGSALGAFAVAENPADGHFFLADTARHRILELDSQGAYLRTVIKRKQLCFPNKILTAGGYMYVVNTNHHNLLRYQIGKWIQPDRTWLTVARGRESIDCPKPSENFHVSFLHRERSTRDRAMPFTGQSAGRIWPIDAARDKSGGWWILNAANGMKFADLIHLSADGTLNDVALTGSDPTALTIHDDAVLMTDFTAARIIKLNIDDGSITEFGDADFRRMMQAVRDKSSRQQYKYYLGIGSIVTALLIVLVVLVLASDRCLKSIPRINAA